MIVHKNCSINKKLIKNDAIMKGKQCEKSCLLAVDQRLLRSWSPATICLLLLQFGVDGPCAWCAQATLGSSITWWKVQFEVEKGFCNDARRDLITTTTPFDFALSLSCGVVCRLHVFHSSCLLHLRIFVLDHSGA